MGNCKAHTGKEGAVAVANDVVGVEEGVREVYDERGVRCSEDGGGCLELTEDEVAWAGVRLQVVGKPVEEGVEVSMRWWISRGRSPVKR